MDHPTIHVTESGGNKPSIESTETSEAKPPSAAAIDEVNAKLDAILKLLNEKNASSNE